MDQIDLEGNVIHEPVVEEAKKPKIGPFDFVNAISSTKEDLMVDEWSERQYNPFVINRALSFGADTAVQANEMNKYRDLPKAMQFRFLSETIRKKKRYNKWEKYVEPEKIQLIKTFYKYSTAKAMEVAALITDEQLACMKQRMFRGGSKNGS